MSLGPFFMLMLFGFKLIVKKLSVLSLMLLGWAIFPIPGIPLFRFFLPDLGDVYFLETSTYIPIGILAGFGAMYLEIIFAKRLKIIRKIKKRDGPNAKQRVLDGESFLRQDPNFIPIEMILRKVCFAS